LWFSKSRERILAVDLGRTRVSILGRYRDFTHREFQECRTVASRNRDPRFPDRIRAVQTAGTRVRRSRRVGDRGIESPVHMTTGIAISRNAISRHTPLHRASGYRESRKHSNKSCEIAKRDFPISQGTMGPTEGSTVDRWHRVSGYREFRGQGVHALRNREPRKPT
jgi:hypothetical protein